MNWEEAELYFDNKLSEQISTNLMENGNWNKNTNILKKIGYSVDSYNSAEGVSWR